MRRCPAPASASALALLLALAAAAPARGQEGGGQGLAHDLLAPSGWDERTPLDLVVCLHGSGGSKETFARIMKVLVPEMRRHLRLYVSSPSAQGWPYEGAAAVAELVAAVRAERPVRRVIVFGFSAGGMMATACFYEHPQVFDAALVGGATTSHVPPSAEVLGDRFVYWSLGGDDEHVAKNGGAERLRGWLEQAAWDPERYRIDVVEGLGHTLDRASVAGGLAWLRGRLDGRAALEDDLRAAIAGVPELVAAGDLEALRALGERVLAHPGGEARELLAQELLDLPRDRRDDVALAGIELLGRLGEPAGVGALRRALRGDDAAALAAVRALGWIPSDEAAEALEDLLGDWDQGGAVQLAAAEGLARIGSDEQVRALMRALKYAERKPGRAAYVEALDRALQGVTGHEIQSFRMWQAWHRQLR